MHVMKLNHIIAFFIFLITSPIVAQQNNKANLSVGDYLPEFVIPKIINSAKKIGNTADYKDKLLIIDFWGTTCKTCIEQMPRMEELQKKYISCIKILPVTVEKEELIRALWKNNKYLKGLIFPTVVEDKIFSTYFKHIYLPHDVWIYKGKVIGITTIDYVDEYNIKRVLNGELVKWPIVNDFLKYDMKTPLFNIDLRQVDPSFPIEYTIISGARENVNSYAGISKDTLSKTIRSFMVNNGILSSYFTNWISIIPLDSLIKPSKDLQANQVLWEVKDRSKYIYEKKEGNYFSSWRLGNGICFESVYVDKGQSDKDIHRSMILDMDRLMGLHVRWEKVKKKVWVVTKDNHINNNYEIKKVTGEKFSLYELINKLNQRAENPYVFNESGDEKSQISIDVNMLKDISSVRNVLKKYGFKMDAQDKEVHMLIFTEVDGPWFPIDPSMGQKKGK